jgi:hypothetical protein
LIYSSNGFNIFIKIQPNLLAMNKGFQIF